jgi:hypothetical protein
MGSYFNYLRLCAKLTSFSSGNCRIMFCSGNCRAVDKRLTGKKRPSLMKPDREGAATVIMTAREASDVVERIRGDLLSLENALATVDSVREDGLRTLFQVLVDHRFEARNKPKLQVLR